MNTHAYIYIYTWLYKYTQTHVYLYTYSYTHRQTYHPCVRARMHAKIHKGLHVDLHPGLQPPSFRTLSFTTSSETCKLKVVTTLQVSSTSLDLVGLKELSILLTILTGPSRR